MSRIRRKKIFINANLSKNSVQAQDRDGKYYALFLNPEKYKVYAYSTDTEVEAFLKNKENISYFIASSRLKIMLKTITTILFSRIDVFLSSKAFWKEYLYFKIHKIFNRGTTVLVLVNNIPYLWFKFDLKIFSKVVKSSDKVIAISKKIAKTFAQYYQKETHIIPLFYDVSIQQTNLSKNEKKRIICVGSMISHKRPFVFCDLAKSLPDYDFIWVGKGYYYDWLSEKKTEQNIDNLQLIPKMLQNDLFQLLGSCDLFYFPSIHEGFPNVLVEAMNCGLPVVCYHSFGPDAIIDGYNGVVLENIFDSKEAIKSLLENEDKLMQVKLNAKSSVSAFNGELLTAKLEALIES